MSGRFGTECQAGDVLADLPPSDWSTFRLWTEEDERWQGSVTSRRRLSAYLKRRAARTLTELWEAIGEAKDNYTPAGCQNYFTAAGYDHV